MLDFFPKLNMIDTNLNFMRILLHILKKDLQLEKLRTVLSYIKKKRKIIDKVEEEFQVEKELLLALMGIETNFGNYLGKMDIVSSLATLSFDKEEANFLQKNY